MTDPGFAALAPLLLLAGWGSALLLVDAFLPRRRKGITAALAAIGLGAALVLVIGQPAAGPCSAPGSDPSCFGGMVRVDGFSRFLQALVLGTALAVIALAYDYLKRMGLERGEFYVLLVFAVMGMMLMAVAADLIIVFLALELLSIPLYVLAGLARPRLESEESAMKYFLLGSFASGFVVYGVALIFGATGTTQLDGIAEAARSVTPVRSLLYAGAGFVLVGLCFKVAVVPFHMWTPDVYHGAPSVVTAFMSVGAKAGGFAALLRVFLTAFPGQAAIWAPVAMAISALTMAWGNVAAIAQSNIKRLLAYSSIAHAGYILMALPAAAGEGLAEEATRAALFYLLAYAATNLGAWGVVLAVERAEGRGLEVDEYSGLASRRPGLALAMAVFMFSLTGVPPTAGFLAKFYLFQVVIDAGLIWLALVGVITSLISAYYYLRVVVVMYMRPGEPETRRERWLDASVAAAGLITFVLGILPGPAVAFAQQAALLAHVP
jgi:NADH-quinone oxidoreductase subunit N